MFHKKKTYRIDIKSADSSLQNIFSACEQTPVDVSVGKLQNHEKSKQRIYNILTAVAALLLVLTFLLPLPFYYIYKNAPAPGPVTVTDHYVENSTLYIEIAPNGNIISYQSAYMITNDGLIYEVSSYDSRAHVLCFPYLDQECNIYIPYGTENNLHLLLTPH